MNRQNTIPIFIGYDERERAATNVLIDTLYQTASHPISVTPLVTEQLTNLGIYTRTKDPKQSTAFSFTRFLVPYLCNYSGWAIFMDCDMLCRKSISELWNQRDERYSVMCVKHNHLPNEERKFLNEIQSSYPKKNWSSLMLLNCEKCTKLTIEYVNNASGLDLHRFNWLEGEHLIGDIVGDWNHLIGVYEKSKIDYESPLVHWTLGGPWFKELRTKSGALAAEWFAARDEAMKLWD